MVSHLNKSTVGFFYLGEKFQQSLGLIIGYNCYTCPINLQLGASSSGRPRTEQKWRRADFQARTAAILIADKVPWYHLVFFFPIFTGQRRGHRQVSHWSLRRWNHVSSLSLESIKSSLARTRLHSQNAELTLEIGWTSGPQLFLWTCDEMCVTDIQ